MFIYFFFEAAEFLNALYQKDCGGFSGGGRGGGEGRKREDAPQEG